MQQKKSINASYIADYIDFTTNYLKKATGLKLNSIPQEEYKTKLHEVVNALFPDGRYSQESVVVLDDWCRKSFVKAVHNLSIINQLTPSQRSSLRFLQDVSEVGKPLYEHHVVDLSTDFWGFTDTRFSIANQELQEYILNSPYRNTATLLLLSLGYTYSHHDPPAASIVWDSMSYAFEGLDTHLNKDEREKKVNDIYDTLIDIDNHFELGKRLNLSIEEQFIYDAFDTFISKIYFYKQVDAAKAMVQWLHQYTWEYDTWDTALTQHQLIAEKVESISKEYDFRVPMPDLTTNYIYNELLHLPIFKPEDDEKYKHRLAEDIDDLDDLDDFDYDDDFDDDSDE